MRCARATSWPKRPQPSPLANVLRLPAEIAPASTESMSLTLIGLSFNHAPWPASAQASSPYTGAEETPTIN